MPKVMLSPKAMKRVAPSALTVPSESPGVGSPSCGTAPRVSVAPVALGDVGVWAQRAAATATRTAASNRAPPGRDEPRDMPCHFTVPAEPGVTALPWARVFPAADLRPMLAVATEVDPPLEDPRLVYEPKYDGIRAIVQVDPGPAPQVRLWSRNGNEKSRQFPELVAALSAWAASLDGPGGARRRDRRARRHGRAGRLPAAAGPDQRLGARAIARRRPAQTPAEQPAALMSSTCCATATSTGGRGRCTSGAPRSRPACAQPGLAAAPPDAPGGRRRHGRSTSKPSARDGRGCWSRWPPRPTAPASARPEWRKFKIQQQDEFVVAGWTEPKGTRTQFRRAGPGGPRPRRQRWSTSATSGPASTARSWTASPPCSGRWPPTSCPFDPPPKTLGQGALGAAAAGRAGALYGDDR